MLARVALFWRCVRHVPRRQLLRRLWLESKRRFIMSPLGRPFRRRRHLHLALSKDLPIRIFEPRREQVVCKSGEYYHRLLNREFSLKLPIDWSLKSVGDTTHLQRLAFHYHECLESLPFEVGRDVVLDWIEQNPPWQPGYWKDSWNSYAISIRCVCWLQWLAQYRSQLEVKDQTIILGSLVEQIRFLAGNLETDICGNHLIKNIKCLLWAGRCFEGAEASKWSHIGRRLLRREMRVQLLSDGMHFELSPAYHCQVFADLLECAQVLYEPESADLVKRLRDAAQVIVDLTHPDGFISLFGDGGLRMAYLPAECLSVYESLGGQSVKAREHFAFHEAGYFGMRTDRTYIVIDCGPPCADALPAHGHGDILSFEWDVDGQRVIVDPGVYEYEAGERRTASRSAHSHNTVAVLGRDQCEFVGSFRVGNRAKVAVEELMFSKNRLTLVGSHDGYSDTGHGIVHRRVFVVSAMGLKIRDEVIGAGGIGVKSSFLFGPWVDLSGDQPSVSAQLRGAGAEVKLNGVEVGATAVFNPDFGVSESAITVRGIFHEHVCEVFFVILD
jgi:hypothetical protein